VNSAIIPILYVLAILGSLLVSTSGPAARAIPPSLFLAPVLYLLGMRLRRLRGSGALLQIAPSAIAQVLTGTFLLGGGLYVAGMGPEFPGSGKIAGALLLGLAASLGNPGPRNALLSSGVDGSDPEPSPHARGEARLGTLLEGQIYLTFLVAIPILSALGILVRPEPLEGGALSVARDIFLEVLKGFAVGAAWGFPGILLLGIVRAGPPRAALHLAIACAAAVTAGFSEGSTPLASITAGFLCAGPARAERDPREPGGRGSGFPGADLISIASGAGLLVLAASLLEPGQLLSALPWAAAIWLGSVILRFLIQFGFGGARRWFRPGDIPARWLPALAWGSYPGPASMGFLLVGLGPGLWQAGGKDSDGLSAILLILIALALLIQGATTRAALRRAEQIFPRAEGWGWERLRARAIVLRAQRRAVDDLRFRGDLDEESVRAMEEAINSAERLVEMERDEISTRDPRIRSLELSRAVRGVLASGVMAVREARIRGLIPPEVAGEIEDDLVRRMQRAGSVSLHELLGEPRDGESDR